MDKNTYTKIIKIYSIIGIVMGAFVTILGLILLFAGGSGLKENPLVASLGLLLIFIALLMIILGVIEIAINVSLWRGRDWARWIVIILGTISMVSYRNWFAMILELIFYGFLVYILFIDKNSKSYFKKRR